MIGTVPATIDNPSRAALENATIAGPQPPFQSAVAAPATMPTPSKPPSMLEHWAKDEKGNFKDLNGKDVAIMLNHLKQYPQLTGYLTKAYQSHSKEDWKSTGDFRKDAMLGGTHLMAMLSGNGIPHE